MISLEKEIKDYHNMTTNVYDYALASCWSVHVVYPFQLLMTGLIWVIQFTISVKASLLIITNHSVCRVYSRNEFRGSYLIHHFEITWRLSDTYPYNIYPILYNIYMYCMYTTVADPEILESGVRSRIHLCNYSICNLGTI